MPKLLLAILILLSNQSIAQMNLTPELLDKHAFRFSINSKNSFSDSAQIKWKTWIGDNQFVGLAEVHNSKQLSLFSTALLTLLSEHGFKNFALELGPNSANILSEYASNSMDLGEKINELNNQYGKNSVYKTPLIFVNKRTDALFMNKASKLGYRFWGLDQEYAFSYEMLLDRLYSLQPNPGPEQLALYEDAKDLLQKNIYKDKVKGQPIYCWYQSNKTINDYLDSFKEDLRAKKIVVDIRESWDIYCKSASGIGSNQQRADHMKQNFKSYYAESEAITKVFLKLGGVHLTHGLSPFGVEDMGKFLHETAAKNNTGFLSIRHLIAYRNGKSNIGKSGWKSVSMFLELGRKDKWTIVDLRPLREQLINGSITTNKKYSYELLNYDLLLLSPDDQYDKPNY